MSCAVPYGFAVPRPPPDFRILLATPPLVACNTPYPAAPALAAWMERAGWPVAVEDLSLALVRRFASVDGFDEIIAALRDRWAGTRCPPPSVAHVLRHGKRLRRALPMLVGLLEGPCGARPALAPRAAASVPEGARFNELRAVPPGHLPPPDELARIRASLALDDLADAVREGLDPDFGFSRYAERLAAHLPEADPLFTRLRRRRTLMDRWMDAHADAAGGRWRPRVLAITVPFPGALYGALRLAARARRWTPRPLIAIGGGYVTTELRELKDPRLFDWVDAVVLDDGEIPLQRLVERAAGFRPTPRLVRTLVRRGGRVVKADDPAAPVVRHRDRPAPAWRLLGEGRYLGMAESLNPMFRLWSERRWIKLTLAHGCYWRQCAFCDTSLDYIRRFDPADPETVLGWMEQSMRETGESGFHFTDEAAPPALLRRVAEGIIRRRWRVQWWGNIRFEPVFDAPLARRLARSGCIAVTGGIECADDRLLSAMCKGVTLDSTAKVMRSFARAGIMVHAYLMYGYPGQGRDDILRALDWVRRAFRAGILHSAYWHRFALTVHSAMARDPRRFGCPRASRPRGTFARNEMILDDPNDALYRALAPGLHAAVHNYMLGIGWDRDVRKWFDTCDPGAGAGV